VVLFAPYGSSLRVDPELNDLKAAVAEGRIQRFAIANPGHSPYGRAARAVLERAGLWDAIQPELVVAENASQAMEFLAHGSSQAGIVPLSLAKAQEMAKLGNFALIAVDSHREEPLKQRMVLLKNAGDTATAFYRYSSIATCRNRPPARDSHPLRLRTTGRVMDSSNGGGVSRSALRRHGRTDT
jgi:molybdate transport system substrate-binding protein